ncbi:MAG: TolC family protein [Myxococcota bacterium]
MRKLPLISIILLLITPADSGAEEYRLNELIELAKNRVEFVRIAESEKERIEGLRDEAYGSAYPKLQATALIGGPVPQALGDVENVSTSSEVGPYSFNNFGVLVREEINVLVPFYTFGKIADYKKAGDHGALAAEQGVKVKKAEVTRDVYKAYWGYQTTEAALKKLAEGEKTVDKVADKISKWLDEENPAVTEIDRLKLDYFSYQLKLRKLAVKRAQEQAKNAIALLTGMNAGERFDVAHADILVFPKKVGSLPELTEKANRFRPELKFTLHSRLAMLSLYEAAQKYWFPSFFVGAEFKHSWSNATTDQTNPFVRDDWNYIEGGVGFGLKLEYDFMVNRAKERQARGEYDKASAIYDLAARGAPLDVKEKYESLQKAREKCELRAESEAAVKRWLTAEMMNFEMGIVDTRSLIEALVASFEAELTRISAAFEYREAYADLQFAVGKTEELNESDR